MPIGLEQWRVQIGLLYASRMPRAIVASKGRKYRRMKWSSLLSFCLALVDILLRTISDAVDTGKQVSRKTISWWKAQLSSPSVFQSLYHCKNRRVVFSQLRSSQLQLSVTSTVLTHSRGEKGLSLLMICLMVVQMLLIMSGDVEENPGPLTRQESRLEVGDLVIVQRELVTVTSKWRNIGLELGFHSGTLNEIQEHKLDPSSCLQEMLDRWLRTVNPPPTWEALAKALEREIVGEYRLAQQLRDKYRKLQQTKHDDQGTCTSVSAHRSGVQNTEADTGGGTSVCMKGSPSPESQFADCPIKQQLPPSISVDTEFENLARRPKGQQGMKGTDEVVAVASAPVSALVLRREESLDGEITELQDAFLDLVVATADALKDVNLFRLKVYITQLPVSTSKYLHNIKIVAGSASAINSAQSVIEIFTLIGTYRYWNFLNCGMLEGIVKKFGSRDDRRNMKAYLEKLEIFCRHTKVRDFVNWARAGLQPHHYSDLTTTMEDEWMDRSLEELQRFQLGLSRHLLIDNYKPPIKGVEPGSLILSLSLHRSFPVNELVLQCQSETTQHFLRQHGVLKMVFKGVCAFDHKSPQNILQQLETVTMTNSEQLQREHENIKATLKEKKAQVESEQEDRQTMEKEKEEREQKLQKAMVQRPHQLALQYAESVQQASERGQSAATEGEGQGREVIEQLERQNRDLQEQLHHRDKQLQEKDIIIAAKQTENQDLQQQLQSRNDQLQAKNVTIAARQRDIQHLKQELQQANQRVQKNDEVIEARERQLREVNQQLQQVTAEFQQNLLQKERMIRDLEDKAEELQQRQSSRRTGGESIELTWREGGMVPLTITCTGVYRGAAAVEGSVAYVELYEISEVYAYDLEKEEWSQLPDCPHSLFSLAVVEGMVTAVGGMDSVFKATNTLLSLTGQGESGKWVEHFPPMPTKRSLTAVAYDGRNLIVAGGWSDYIARMSTVEVMDTENLQWYTATSLPHPLSEATATICGDRVYVLGGDDQNDRATKSVLTCSLTSLLQSYQPQSLGARLQETSTLDDKPSVWHTVADIPVYGSSCITLRGELVAVGGYTSDYRKTTAAVYQYSPSTNSWQVISHMKTAREKCFVAVLNNELMVVGGCTPGHVETDVVEIATVL